MKPLLSPVIFRTHSGVEDFLTYLWVLRNHAPIGQMTVSSADPRKTSSIKRGVLGIFSIFILPLFSGLLGLSKRAAYELPDGAELIVGAIRTTFVCSNDGYYADMDNNCQIFHICQLATHAEGTTEMLHWSFLCGNQTVFNQFAFTCSRPEDSIPCANSGDFYYLNANLHAGPNSFFHSDTDVAQALSITPGRGDQSAFVSAAGGASRPFSG
ncbi:chitin-binding type-2 domain-containing protein [Trichonephila clavata]|uniref:Chitin-binding type-2 domain-containing protein n=1 Tax=Trichonephila clavata TaxID=2740835 RepID=A0A8X6HNX4_TRICU|nr:chitin-binding type-2 domain-containing protein [Trichonephila clavata]